MLHVHEHEYMHMMYHDIGTYTYTIPVYSVSHLPLPLTFVHILGEVEGESYGEAAEEEDGGRDASHHHTLPGALPAGAPSSTDPPGIGDGHEAGWWHSYNISGIKKL